MRVLFVCTGNICRSPTAERLAQVFAREAGLRDFVSASAGTRAVIGQSMHEHAARVLRQFGGDDSGFVSRQLTAKIAADADVVLTMTRRHRDSVLQLTPKMLHRTFTLSEASQIASLPEARRIDDLAELRPGVSASAVEDVPDPIGRDLETFREVGFRIAKLLEPVLGICS